MKWIVVSRIRLWYVYFAAGVFLTVAMLSGILQPIMTNSIDINKIKPIYHGNITEPKIAFACNVFWGEEFLPDMLQTFATNNIKITFFIGGSWAKKYPDLVAEMSKQGHELGNHTYSHPHPNTISKEKNKEQVIKTEELVKEITGVKTNLYAPPYGEFNDTVLLAAQELGYTTTLWSVDTVDWKRPAPDIIKARVLKKVHNGAIILMHPTDPTAKALPGLIAELQTMGYNITTVTDILKTIN